jgi:hypothetical protein
MTLISSILAQGLPPDERGGSGTIFGSINPPAFLNGLNATTFFGKLLDRTVKLLVIGAGVYALINLILAGYSFMSAGDDPKKVATAWSMIYQTIIGLAVAAGAFVLAAIFSKLLFGNYMFLLQPQIPKL